MDSTPLNGQVEPMGLSNGQYLVDTTVTFTCDSGYSLQGSASSTCQVSGIWDPLPPTCSLGEYGSRLLQFFFLFLVGHLIFVNLMLSFLVY